MQGIKGLIIAAIIIAVVIVGGVFFFAKQNPNASNGNPAPTQTAQQTDNATIITLSKSGFAPNNLTIKAGTTVKWVNDSGAAGQIDSDPHPVHTSYPPMNFQAFSNGSSVELVFDKPGTYHYHNHLNPSQTGTITVQ
ncbi:MAG TPA: cupredoxin domain-containing protein [Patescibacteria group bacterium]